MLHAHQRLFHRTFLASEVAILLTAASFASVPDLAPAAYMTDAAVAGVAWLCIAGRLGLYRSHRIARLTRELEALVVTLLLAVAITTLAGTVLRDRLAFAPGTWLLHAGVALVALRGAVRLALRALRRRGRNFRRAVLVGGGPAADEIVERVASQPHLGIRLEGWMSFRDQREAVLDCDDLGTVDGLQGILATRDVDVVLVCPPAHAGSGEIEQVVELCAAAGIRCQIAPAFLRLEPAARPDLEWYGDVAVLDTAPKRRDSLQYAIKAVADLALAACGVALLAPLYCAIAVAIKLDSRGPVLFRQRRVGRGGRTFPCFKFRTMHVGAEAQLQQLVAASQQDGPAFKMADDPRITRVGRLLRKYSLDELPQLFNVLRGEMSLVGPRPPIPAEVERYDWWQRRRVSVRPGLTCIWQVHGRNRVSFQEWMEMDLEYLENWSLWLDVKLLCGTAGTVLRGTGM